MKSKESKRILKRAEKEIRGHVLTRPLFDRSISVVIPDTSALIDLERITHSYTGSEAKYARSDLFLNSFIEGNRTVLIPGGVIGEVQRHRKVKLNHHVYEISPEFVGYLIGLYKNTGDFLRRVEYGLDPEQIGYDVWYTSKLACENSKKQKEDFSDVDKDLLEFACLFGRSKINLEKDEQREIGLVSILSSDEHIIQGAKFLREQGGDNYRNIKAISLRK